MRILSFVCDKQFGHFREYKYWRLLKKKQIITVITYNFRAKFVNSNEVEFFVHGVFLRLYKEIIILSQ